MSRLVLLLALVLPTLAQAETVRLGLFVGNDLGFGEDEPLRHAENEARDMARIFQDMGGLQAARTTVLTGKGEAAVRDEVDRLEVQIRELRAAGDQVLLLFYYSGHASRDGLHLSGSLLPMPWLRRWLEGSQADLRVAFVDACESGSLARNRGGTPVEVIEVRVDDSLTAAGLALITSTGPLSVARESDSFGGGVFSRALATGLRGSADLDADGTITLAEAYRHSFGETVVGTAGTSAIQRPELHTDLSAVGDVVLTRVQERAAGLVLPEELEGVYTVVSVASGQVVARIDKPVGELRRLSLPSGRYVVRKVRRQDVLVAELDLVWGGDRWVEDSQMSSVPVGDPLARGGWTERPVRLSLRGVFSTPIVSANPVMGGGELAARFRLGPGVGLLVGGGYETGDRWEWLGRLRSGASRAFVGVQGEKRFRNVDLVFGGGAMGLLMHQDLHYTEQDGRTISAEEVLSRQLTLGGFAEIGLHLPVGPLVGLEVGARGIFYPVDVDDAKVFFAMAHAWGGVAFRFGGPKVGQTRRGKKK